MNRNELRESTLESRRWTLTAYPALAAILCLSGPPAAAQLSPIVDTGQSGCYDDAGSMKCPREGRAFYGQDAQYQGHPASYEDHGDGTVTDLVTGLMWQTTPTFGRTFEKAKAGTRTATTGGYHDWRLPTIRELYSLMNFDGVTGRSSADSIPYLDTDVFDFEYGDATGARRFIDAQYCSSTEYLDTTMNGNATVFGVNFADGRIKGYPQRTPRGAKTFHVRYVRGREDYGDNDFADNGDLTISDRSTGLMWSQLDSGLGMDWKEALEWVEARNVESYMGYQDWRLPNAKELQSIVDYARAPGATSSAAIDPVFSISRIDNSDYPYFWSSTTHLDGPSERRGSAAVYLAFGRALGYMRMPPHSSRATLVDVHGAGAQRSDPKSGSASAFPQGRGPQGDVIRIDNYVRLVRDIDG